jgi:hypothetical protein
MTSKGANIGGLLSEACALEATVHRFRNRSAVKIAQSAKRCRHSVFDWMIMRSAIGRRHGYRGLAAESRSRALRGGVP